MKWFLLTHVRKLFRLWCILGALLWLAGVLMRPDAPVTLFLLWMLWIQAGFWGGNLFAGWMGVLAFRRLDEDCDPEPLLAVSQSVLAQNPNACCYRVYEAWALSLLGRQEEAAAAAALAEGRRRLWRKPRLLLMWSAALPPDDPRQKRAEAALERFAGRKLGRHRAMIRSALERQRIYAQMSRGADELEPALLAALEQAGCTREQVGAHLALGLYYLQRGDTARVQAHLSFVAAHGNKLKVRAEAERLLCRMPAV